MNRAAPEFAVHQSASLAPHLGLYVLGDPAALWQQAAALAERIVPGADLTPAAKVYAAVLQLFAGSHPGYRAIATPYHDRDHTLEIFMCALCVMHGLQLSGQAIGEQDLLAGMIGALLHDAGYAQTDDDLDGTGAKYTLEHVQRGIAYMHRRAADFGLSPALEAAVDCVMQCTDHRVDPANVAFPDPTSRLIGLAVGSADLVGQMSDRTYLEKLLYLYVEFKEAQIGDYRGMYDLLCKTSGFYQFVNNRLETDLHGVYHHLDAHFQAEAADGVNYYATSIAKNFKYLDSVLAANEEEFLACLKRGGIVQQIKEVFGEAVLQEGL
jgi:hypothetical protein